MTIFRQVILALLLGGVALLFAPSGTFAQTTVVRDDFVQQGAGAMPRTLLEKARAIASLKDFGAVGDGIANDTTAIQRAARSGRTVVIPPGSYRLRSRITFDVPGTRFVGQSLGGIIPAQTGTVRFVKVSTLADVAFSLDTYRIALEYFSLDCEAGSAGYGIQTRGQAPVIRNVSVYGCGVRIGKDTLSGHATSGAFLLDNVTIANPPGIGLHIYDVNPATPSNGGTVIAPRVLFATHAPSIVIEASQHNDIYNPLAEGGTKWGIELRALANNNRIFGGDLDENRGGTIYGMHIVDGATDNVIIGTATAQKFLDDNPSGNRTRVDIPYNGAKFPGQNRIPVPTTMGGPAIQASDSMLGIVKTGNAIEFGYPSTMGYRNHIGATANTGKGYIAFGAEAGTTADTFRTRGHIGTVLMSNLAGGGGLYTIPLSNADNQTPVGILTWTPTGITAAQPIIAGPDPGGTGVLRVGGVMHLGGGMEPICNATNRGALVLVQGGTGVADTVRICTKDAANVYAYRSLF